MKKIRILSLLLLLVSLFQLQAARQRISRDTQLAFVSRDTIEVADGVELRLTDANPIRNNALIILEGPEAWVYLLEVRPTKVISSYLKSIKLGSELTSLVHRSNCRAEIYRHGCVVIPQNSFYQPLEAFTEPNFGGSSATYGILTYHTDLGAMTGAIRSFKLKKGYMATLATAADGTGFSRVFIADSEDLEIPQLQVELDQNVAYIRVFQWRWPSQKGWCWGPSAARLDSVQATWYYDWDANGMDNYMDAEYVPMRHNAGWQAFSVIESRRYSTHVLGFNEPDNPNDDGPMTVDETVAMWPKLMKSGLRLGSLATTDGGLNYLYEFMDKCDALNYRVDFVAVHFYRGGQSPWNLYSFVKGVHDRTGRPIWITEWNNGANWTSETWPSNVSEQQAKQLRDMTAFFNMLDTCSFVERHAVYNAVEYKRYMLDPDNGNRLTPAGKMMRDFKAKMAYNPAKEFEPLPWKIKAPNLISGMIASDFKSYNLRLGSNPNGTLAAAYLVEKSVGSEDFEQIDSVTDLSLTVLNYPVDYTRSGSTSFRMRTVGKNGEYSGYTKAVSYHTTPADSVQLGELTIANTEWNPLFFGQEHAAEPAMILGAASFRNLVAFAPRARNLTTKKVDFKLFPYEYISNQTISNAESLPFLFVSKGVHDWGGLKAIAGKSAVGGNWTSISFPEAFETVPVVFAQQITSVNSTATAIRIRNVTKEGFQAKIAKELAQTYNTVAEAINWLAVSPGEGKLNGRDIVVGSTASTALGTSSSSWQVATIKWGKRLTNPLFFAFMQTANDERAAVVRRHTLSSTTATVFKQTEGSQSVAVQKEGAGWLVIDNPEPSGLNTTDRDEPGLRLAIHNGILFFETQSPGNQQVEILDAWGRVVLQTSAGLGNRLDVSTLPRGCYLLRVGNAFSKFIR